MPRTLDRRDAGQETLAEYLARVTGACEQRALALSLAAAHYRAELASLGSYPVIPGL